MAIYQFLTYVLPKRPIEKKYGRIPQQLEIKHDEWEDYWKNFSVELENPPEPNFEDAVSTKWWKELKIDIEKLSNEIDGFISRSELNDEGSWKTKNTEFDHDVSIDYNNEENFIEDFRFRTDLRDTSLIFLKSLLDLCKQNEWLLMDNNGNLIEPKIKDYFEWIKNSAAMRYLNDPGEYFENLK